MTAAAALASSVCDVTWTAFVVSVTGKGNPAWLFGSLPSTDPFCGAPETSPYAFSGMWSLPGVTWKGTDPDVPEPETAAGASALVGVTTIGLRTEILALLHVSEPTAFRPEGWL